MAYEFSKPVFRPSDLPTGLVGYWKFNNDDNDSSTSGYDLTPAAGGAAPTYSQIDYWKSGEYSSVFASASKQYFSLASASCPLLEITEKFSMAFWIKLTSGTANQYVATKYDAGGDGDGYGIIINSSNIPQMNMDNTAYAATTAISVGKWHHVCMTYDGANILFYLDGNLDKATALANYPNASGVDFLVGKRSGLTEAYLNGTLKDLAIWNHGTGAVLTPLQIKSLALGVDLSKYAYRPNNVSTQPTHWWKLNEVSGNRADSVSTNPLTLTDVNSVLSSGGYLEGVSADFEAATSEHFTTSDDGDFDFGTGAFSIAVWLKRESIGAAVKFYSLNGDDDISFGFEATNAIVLYMGGVAKFSYAFTPVAETWYHLCATRDGSNNLKLYVDGVEVDTDTSSHDVTHAGLLYIGARAGSAQFFDGELQDLAVWKGYTLTATEIASLACALPVQRQGIVLYSKMNGAADSNETSEIGSYTLDETNGVGSSASGQVGNCRDFVSTNSEYFLVTRDATLDLINDFSILGWIYPDDNTDVNIIGKNQQTGGYGVLLNSTSYLEFRMNGQISVSTTTFATTGFNQFGAIFTGAERKVYRNSVQEDSDAYTTVNTDNSTNLYIGASSTPASYFDGRLDELVIAQRYFRPEEIKTAYCKGLNGKEVTTSERPTGINRVLWIM